MTSVFILMLLATPLRTVPIAVYATGTACNEQRRAFYTLLVEIDINDKTRLVCWEYKVPK